MKTNANKQKPGMGEVKRVLLRKHDRLKFVVIPRRCNIEAGDLVLIKKFEVYNG